MARITFSFADVRKRVCVACSNQYTVCIRIIHSAQTFHSLEKPLAHGDQLPNKGLLIEKGNVRGAPDERVNAAVVVLDKGHVEPREIHAGVGGGGRREQRIDHFGVDRTPHGIGGGGGAVLDARRVVGNVLRAVEPCHARRGEMA